MAAELEISWLQNYTVSLSLALDFCIRLILSFPGKNSSGIKKTRTFSWNIQSFLNDFSISKRCNHFWLGKLSIRGFDPATQTQCWMRFSLYFLPMWWRLASQKFFWRKRHRKTFFRILVVLFYRVIDCYAVCKHESLFSSLVFVSITQKWKKRTGNSNERQNWVSQLKSLSSSKPSLKSFSPPSKCNYTQKVLTKTLESYNLLES